MSYPTYSVSALWAMVHPTLHSPFRRSAVMDEQRVIVMNREPTCDGTTHVHELVGSSSYENITILGGCWHLRLQANSTVSAVGAAFWGREPFPPCAAQVGVLKLPIVEEEVAAETAAERVGRAGLAGSVDLAPEEFCGPTATTPSRGEGGQGKGKPKDFGTHGRAGARERMDVSEDTTDVGMGWEGAESHCKRREAKTQEFASLFLAVLKMLQISYG
eukprot:1157590-Pelagomonas_calceolata.AAC.4